MSYAGDWKPKFLCKLKETKSARLSARLADVPWTTVTSARHRDESFRRAWDDAIAAPPGAEEEVTLTLPAEVVRILREHLNSVPKQS